MFWTSSDIWNHLYTVFTGQPVVIETGSAAPGNEPQQDPGSQGEYWGKCYQCFGEVYDPEVYIECINCAANVLITDDTFSCTDCPNISLKSDIGDDDLWLYHPACGNLLYYPAFLAYNNWGTTQIGNKITVLEVRGSFEPDGTFHPEPWYSYKSPVAILTSNLAGEYSASVYDRNGRRLSIVYFDVTDDSQINTREGYKWGDGDDDTDIPIRVIVRFHANAAKVVINKGTQEVYSRDLSLNTPKVAFTNLTDRLVLSNKTTLTWEAGDADGDSLTFQLWYYRSEDEMYLVAADLTGTSYDADLTDYPGTNRGWFVILATDGGRTGIARSPRVSVPYKAPDILNYMPDVKQFKVTDLIEIQGRVYDAQDGWLVSEGYKWYVDGRRWETDGFFFIRLPSYLLDPGMHTITMEVTNSAGISSGIDFIIEIIDDESDLPDGWPKNEIILALKFGYYQPLHRLESPITRIELARMSIFCLGLSDYLPEDWVMPTADINIDFTDISNDFSNIDYHHAWTMIALGLMELKNAVYEYDGELDRTFAQGDFDPNGTLTQREAMQIMFMAIELARTQKYTEYSILDESEFLPQLMEWGVIDKSGSFNSYNENELMSKGMTLLRIGRFLDYRLNIADKDYWGESGTINDNFVDD